MYHYFSSLYIAGLGSVVNLRFKLSCSCAYTGLNVVKVYLTGHVPRAFFGELLSLNSTVVNSIDLQVSDGWIDENV